MGNTVACLDKQAVVLPRTAMTGSGNCRLVWCKALMTTALQPHGRIAGSVRETLEVRGSRKSSKFASRWRLGI